LKKMNPRIAAIIRTAAPTAIPIIAPVEMPLLALELLFEVIVMMCEEGMASRNTAWPSVKFLRS